ncbi:MAG: CPBP family intramembrane metalloprotease [Selenomonadales bacterium]|jgi:membrane protease YdiL (CAAX protease family)|nr:CPBP family intramembrane metalloprotease [Selenomonadales bacterium]
MRLLKNLLWVLFLATFLLAVPRLAGVVAGLFDYSSIDPDRTFAWVSVRHSFQAVVFLIFMAWLGRVRSLKFGFTWGNKESGLRYLFVFSVIFGVYTAVMYTIFVLTGAYQPFGYPLTTTNILGQLVFQLLLSGPSEELIFRAFAMTMIALAIKGRVFMGKVSSANIIAAVIFGLAHMRISFAPFTVSYQMPQVLYAIALGVIYGDCYEKTESMYYPMIMHSYTNVVMVGVGIILSFIL